ncbi:hypothetical protein Tco_1490375 [Tanacetum coccineum]
MIPWFSVMPSRSYDAAKCPCMLACYGLYKFSRYLLDTLIDDLIHFRIHLKVSIMHDQEDVELDIDDIEIDEPILVVPTSSHTKRKEEIG